MAFEATQDGNSFFLANLDEVASYFDFSKPNPRFNKAVFPVVLARNSPKNLAFGVIRGTWDSFVNVVPSAQRTNSVAPEGFDVSTVDGHVLYARYTDQEAAAKTAGKAGK